jgi:hypothetical protein
MLGIFFVVFVVGGIASAFAQRRYDAAISGGQSAILSDDAVASRIRARPTGLVDVVPIQTKERLQALTARPSEPELERKRLTALAAVVVCLGGFLGIGLVILGFIAA